MRPESFAETFIRQLATNYKVQSHQSNNDNVLSDEDGKRRPPVASSATRTTPLISYIRLISYNNRTIM